MRSTSERRRSTLFAAPLAVLLVALVSGCVGNRPRWEELTPAPRPEVVRVDDLLRVRWPASFALGPVQIFASPKPDEFDREQPVARTRALATAATIEGLDPTRRFYFELVPESGATPRVVAERRLPLAGGDNFRDIGGYSTEDGHVVRWGLLYRSNNLAELSRDDLRYLSRLRVRLVCDFRSEPERVRDPSRTAGEKPATEELSISSEGLDPRSMQERIRTGITKDELEEIMIKSYQGFVTHHSDQWATMFERILKPGNLPTIVHCTAGKDRTGFASAMVLAALGVPEKTIFEDYMATNKYRAGGYRWIKRAVPIYSLFRTRGQDLDALIEARRPYLQASFDVINEQYGSVDAYLEQRLGLTPDKREQLRQTFLQ